jgi:hypothetical protein
MSRTSIFQAIRGRDEVSVDPGSFVARPQYRPTYENKLRLIGRHLDLNGMRSVKILEVPGGLLARVVGADGITDELLEFPDAGFEQLFERAVNLRNPQEERDDLRLKSAIIPTSYEDVLRGLGAEFDDWAARSIVIAESQNHIYISGIRLENNSMRSANAPFDELLGPNEIDAILSRAYTRRSAEGSQPGL